MTTINSLTTSLYVSQTTISISSAKSTHNDDAQERPAISGRGEKHGHQHGGGAFMRNVVQTLQGFGLSIPGGNGGSDSDDGVENDADGSPHNSSNLGQLLQTFLQDLRQVLKQSGVQQSATETQGDATGGQTPAKQLTSAATASLSATAQTGQAASAMPSANVQAGAGAQAVATATPAAAASTAMHLPQAGVAEFRQALHGFLHDLRQALKYSADHRSGSGVDGQDGDKTTGRNGYGKFTDNLENLVAALSDTSGAAGAKYKELQDSFNDLVNVLGSAANGKKPTLLEFLTALAGNGNNSVSTSSASAKGAIVFETA